MQIEFSKIVAAGAALGLSLLSSPVAAQRYTNYPVCAVYGGIRNEVVSCAFNNFEQCRMSVSGRGGYCTANPDYRPQRGHSRR
jgi:hypothetical protein